MDKKEVKKKKLFRRLISPYRMVIINEETFEERLQFRVSKLSLLLISVFSFVLLGSLFFSSIAFTPLKEFIPGYDSSELRKKAVQNLFVTDSLITLYNQNIKYLNAVKAVLNEEVRFQDPEFSADALSGEDPEPPTFLSSIPEDSLLRAFVTQQDKYNPNLDGGGDMPLETLLLPPALGPISQEFSLKEDHYAVDIVLEQNTPIKAIGDGRVIFAEWTAETGYVIILDHNKGILSVYKHNAALSKKQGDVVQGGEVIALAGNTGEFTTGFHLHFELWIEGYPMNPVNFFNFLGE